MPKPGVATKRVQTYLPGDLVLTATFDILRNEVVEFRVVLHTGSGGESAWLVRIETHGGKPHKHVAWDDHGERRHKELKGWPQPYRQTLTRAIQDMKDNWET